MERVEVIDSRDMGGYVRKEFFLELSGETLRTIYIFHDRLPKTFSLDVYLRAAGATAEIWFALVGKQNFSSEISVRMFHEARNTFGRVRARAALFDQSRVAFRGNLSVAERATGADTNFSASALMMSPESRAEIFPYLEIKTSDVRASHGSSVGRVESRDIFYLRSRGVSEADAEKILLSAFFSDMRALLPFSYQSFFFPHGAIV